MRPITEKQEKWINDLHRQLGTAVPEMVPQMSSMEASNHIDQLQDQLDRKEGREPGSRRRRAIAKYDGALFALAAELVHQKMDADVLEQREEYKEAVRNLFTLLRDLRKEVLQ